MQRNRRILGHRIVLILEHRKKPILTDHISRKFSLPRSIPMSFSFSDISAQLNKPSSRFFVSEHLDSPIIYDGIQEMIDKLSLRPLVDTRSRILAGALVEMNHAVRKELPLVKMAPQDCLIYLNSLQGTDPHLRSSVDTANAYISIVNSALSDSVGTFPSMDYINNSARHWYGVEHVLASVTDLLSSRLAGGSHKGVIAVLDTNLSHIIWTDKNVSIFYYVESDSLMLAPYDQLLALKDCAGSRARAYHILNVLYPELPTDKILSSHINWQSSWIHILGNDGYEIAKQTEALCKAALTKYTDPIFRDNGPYEAMVQKILLKVHKLASLHEVSTDILEELLYQFEEMIAMLDVQLIVELFGLQKLVLHPHIYVRAGGLSAAKEALEPISSSVRNVENLRAAWCTSFTLGFIYSKRHWPKLFFPNGSNTTLLERWYNSGYTNLTHQQFRLEDWEGVRFGKTFDYDFHVNYLDVIEDKSISNYRSEVASYWNPKVKASSERRLLLEILQRETFNVRLICDIVATRQVPRDWKIVSLYPKERELKVAARMFSMMPPEPRTFFVVQEANTANNVFPFLQSQTMTRDKVHTVTRFFSMTNRRSDPDVLRVFVECDLSRWNLRWRGSIINPIARDLDDLHGVDNLYTYVHQFFQESMIVVRTKQSEPDGISLLDPPPSDLLWYNHLGGFEGIAQKTWTIATYAMIDLVMRKFEGSYVLVGQGDNQVLCYETSRRYFLSEEEDVRETVASLTTALSQGCGLVGQDLKPEECIESRTCITYSKRVYLDGIERFLTAKFFSRCFAKTSEEIPSLKEDLTGLWNACAAAAEESSTPRTLLALSIFLITRELQRRIRRSHPEFEQVHRQELSSVMSTPPAFLAEILLIPSSCGGSLPLNPVRFVYHGSADSTGLDVTFLLRCAQVSSFVSGYVRDLKAGLFFSMRCTAEELLESPQSLPLAKIAQRTASTLSSARDYIVRHAKNREVNVATSKLTDTYREGLIISLFAINPCQPVILSDIYTSSPAYEISRLIKMFTSTRTIQTASRSAGYDSTSAIIHHSGNWMIAVLVRLLSIRLSRPATFPSPTECLQTIDDLRSFWVPILKERRSAVTEIIGLTSSNPLMFTFSISRSPILDSGIKAIGYFPPRASVTRGPMQPFFGSKTRALRSEYGYKLVGVSRAIESAKRLAGIASLSATSPQVKQLIREMVMTRVPVDILKKELTAQYYGGSIQHRYAGGRRDQGSYGVSIGNLSTHCFLNTDEIDGVSGSPADYSIMFQEFGCAALSTLFCKIDQSGEKAQYLEGCYRLSSVDLWEVGTGLLSLPAVPKLTPDEKWISSQLVYDPKVKTIALAGPVGASRIIEEVQMSDADHEAGHVDALRACLDLAVVVGRESTYATSSSKHKLSRPNIDLSEAVGATLDRIVEAASRGVVTHSLIRWFADFLLNEQTASVDVYVGRVAGLYGEMISTLSDYSALASDVSLGMVVAHAEYRKSFQYPSGDELISSLIRQRSLKHLHSSPSRFGIIYLYKTERGGISSHTYLSRLAHYLYHNCRTLASIDECARLLLDSPIATLHAIAEESRKIRIIKAWATRVVNRRGIDQHVRRACREFLQTYQVSVVLGDHNIMVRRVRTYPVTVPTADMRGRVTIHQIELRLDTTRLSKTQLVSSISGLSKVAGQVVWAASIGVHRIGLFHSEWASVLDTSCTSHLHLYGVGNGVCALAALDLDVSKVIGYEIAYAYNVKRIRGGYPPPALIQSSRTRRFEWSQSTLTGGDDEVGKMIATIEGVQYPKGSSVVFDILPSWRLEDLISVCRRIPLHCTITIRLRGDIGQDIRDVGVIGKNFLIERIVSKEVGDARFAAVTFRNATLSIAVLRTNALICREELMVPQALSVWSIDKKIDREASFKIACASVFGQPITKENLPEYHSSLLASYGRRLASEKYGPWSISLCRLWLSWVMISDLDLQEAILSVLKDPGGPVSLSSSLLQSVESLLGWVRTHYVSFFIIFNFLNV